MLLPAEVTRMSDLRQQIIASIRPEEIEALSDGVIHALAVRLSPYLSEIPAPEPAGWLDFDGALEYLGTKKGTLYKLTAAKTVPFHQDGPGCKLWFLRSELDEWRQNSGARGARNTHLRAAELRLMLPKCFHEAILAVQRGSPRTKKGPIYRDCSGRGRVWG